MRRRGSKSCSTSRVKSSRKVKSIDLSRKRRSIKRLGDVESSSKLRTRTLSSSSSARDIESSSNATSPASSEERTASQTSSIQLANSLTSNLMWSNSIESELSAATQSLTEQFNISVNDATEWYLKAQLNKARTKFDKACRQLTLLHQQISDMENAYSNAIDADKKPFKSLYKLELATLNGMHNAYLQYIDRQVNRIKKFKVLFFNEKEERTAPPQAS